LTDHRPGGPPGNELAFMPVHEAVRSRIGTQSAPVWHRGQRTWL